jgi:hypothetical protein
MVTSMESVLGFPQLPLGSLGMPWVTVLDPSGPRRMSHAFPNPGPSHTLISLLPFPSTPVGPMPAPPNPEHDKLLSIRPRCIQYSPLSVVDTGHGYISPAALAFLTVWDMVSGSATSDHGAQGPFSAYSNQYTTDSPPTRSSGVIFRHQPFHYATCTSYQTLCEC